MKDSGKRHFFLLGKGERREKKERKKKKENKKRVWW